MIINTAEEEENFGLSPSMALRPKRKGSPSAAPLPPRWPLHNFEFPFNGLKWGTQKLLRCVNNRNPNSNDRRSGSIPQHGNGVKINRRTSPSSSLDQLTSSDEIKGVTTKTKAFVLDCRDGTKFTVSLKKKEKELEDSGKPWNLRKRRAEAPPLGNGDDKEGKGVQEEQNVERAKFSISLRKEEIESDFIAMTGAKPHRRPKKRPKAVQNQLDALFPGMWLTEITPEIYKVPDDPEPPKGKR